MTQAEDAVNVTRCTLYFLHAFRTISVPSTAGSTRFSLVPPALKNGCHEKKTIYHDVRYIHETNISIDVSMESAPSYIILIYKYIYIYNINLQKHSEQQHNNPQ